MGTLEGLMDFQELENAFFYCFNVAASTDKDSINKV